MRLVLAQAKGMAVRIAYSAPNRAASAQFAVANFVDSTVDSQSGTVEFRALVGNEDFSLWPGESLDVGVTLNQLHSVVVVPREAVNSGLEGDYVYAIRRSAKANRVPVIVLNDDGVRDAISGAIGTNEQVVTEGQFRLAPEMRVSVLNAPAPPVSVSDAGDAQ
jgi:multidrug efflux system membrane fusion protein